MQKEVELKRNQKETLEKKKTTKKEVEKKRAKESNEMMTSSVCKVIVWSVVQVVQSKWLEF